MSAVVEQRTEKPLVTVVINNYNYARFLRAAIDSVLAQTYDRLEVVVVDDGSTDDSRSVIASYGGRVRSIFKVNGGQGSAYNAGFRESRGELILFLDSDDLLDPDAVKETVKLWAPDVAKIHFYLRVISGEEGEPTSSVTPANTLADGDLRAQIIQTGYYCGPPSSGNVYSRRALESVMPIPESTWPKAADTFPVYLTPFEGRVSACRRILGSYRIHGRNQGAQGDVDAKLMRYNLQKEQRRDDMLATFFAARGIPYKAGSVSRNFHHLKTRLASLALDASQHPYPQDRLFTLSFQTAKACWNTSGLSISKKLSVTLWALCLMSAPQKYRLRAVELAFMPTKRSRVMQQVVAKAPNALRSTLDSRRPATP